MARKGWIFIGIGATLLILSGVLLGVALNRKASEWAFDMTGIRAVQDQGWSGAGITVAVIDTGIEIDHPSLSHLKGRLIWRDLVNGHTTPYDDVGHGTSVVGILAGKGGSLGARFQGFNLHGAAPDIRLIMVKAIDRNGSGTTGDIADGIDVSVQLEADVICLSLGSQASPLRGVIQTPDEIADAIDRAVARGIPVVAAAGNTGGWTNRTDVESPAVEENVIAVGSVDESHRISKFSAKGSAQNNYGPNEIPLPGTRRPPDQKPEIVAPGEGIRSAYKDQTYATASGTSQAVPFVCGALALLLEAKPQLRSQDNAQMVASVKNALMESASHDVQSLDPENRNAGYRAMQTPHDPYAGYGFLKADGLLASF